MTAINFNYDLINSNGKISGMIFLAYFDTD